MLAVVFDDVTPTDGHEQVLQLDVPPGLYIPNMPFETAVATDAHLRRAVGGFRGLVGLTWVGVHKNGTVFFLSKITPKGKVLGSVAIGPAVLSLVPMLKARATKWGPDKAWPSMKDIKTIWDKIGGFLH